MISYDGKKKAAVIVIMLPNEGIRPMPNYLLRYGLANDRRCGLGFAARCAAVDTHPTRAARAGTPPMPRRRGAFYTFGLCSWCGLWRNKSEGLTPDQGHSPGLIWLLSAGQSHRRTSGGKAEPDVVHDI
jgi:hypothetical protein